MTKFIERKYLLVGTREGLPARLAAESIEPGGFSKMDNPVACMMNL
jgi:hypothetical protein